MVGVISIVIDSSLWLEFLEVACFIFSGPNFVGSYVLDRVSTVFQWLLRKNRRRNRFILALVQVVGPHGLLLFLLFCLLFACLNLSSCLCFFSVFSG